MAWQCRRRPSSARGCRRRRAQLRVPPGHRGRHPAWLPQRQPHLGRARPVLPGLDRPPQPAAARRHRGQPGRAPPRGARRRRAPPWHGHRRAAWGPRPAQGQHRYPRRAQHHGRVASSARLHGERDPGVVARLRRAGAVVLGKASLSEWANFRIMEAGWSARGGQARNPYVLSPSPCGSSAGLGVAAAANLAAMTLGTETDGSILCPSSYNSVVGIKPTLGLTSRAGVIPITPRQDSVGPMCRTVSDAVHVLDAIVGYDKLDAAATAAASKYIPHGGYLQFLKKDGLRGKRIGVSNELLEGFEETQLREYKQHLATMRKHGAVVIENLAVTPDLTALREDIVTQEWTAMQTEFKLSTNEYLADLSYSPVHSLADIIAFNKAHPIEERLKDFGQHMLIAAQNTNGIGHVERARVRWLKELSVNGLEKLMKEHQLDAIVVPNYDASHLLAIGGHPGIAVPAGYDKKGVPFGICFGGLQGYEPRLIEMAYAFEQATKVRRTPMFKP